MRTPDFKRHERNFDLVVFDWDGTIVDSTGLIAAAIRSACRDLGEPVPDEDAARYVIGLGFASAVRHVAPRLAPEAYASFSTAYRKHYFAGEARLTLFDGARELLAELGDAGYKLAIATGKSRAGLEDALGQSGLRGAFHATRCADEGAPKPDPTMLHDLMRTIGAAASRTLMVGDTSHDLQLAQNAGVRSVGVAYGAHGAEALARCAPLAVVDSIGALRSWLVCHG